MRKHVTKHKTEIDPYTGDPIDQETSLEWRIVSGVVAFFCIVALLFMYGGRQFVRFLPTPDAATVPTQAQVIDAENVVSVPVSVFVLKQDETAEAVNTDALIEKANNILHQAAIRLSVKNRRTVNIKGRSPLGIGDIADAESRRQYVENVPEETINIFITQSLDGLNGIAFAGQRTVAVAEYNTGFDFRVLAHEVGHALGLDHVSSGENLMYSGSSGIRLKKQQARDMYEEALDFRRSQ